MSEMERNLVNKPVPSRGGESKTAAPPSHREPTPGGGESKTAVSLVPRTEAGGGESKVHRPLYPAWWERNEFTSGRTNPTEYVVETVKRYGKDPQGISYAILALENAYMPKGNFLLKRGTEDFKAITKAFMPLTGKKWGDGRMVDATYLMSPGDPKIEIGRKYGEVLKAIHKAAEARKQQEASPRQASTSRKTQEASPRRASASRKTVGPAALSYYESKRTPARVPSEPDSPPPLPPTGADASAPSAAQINLAGPTASGGIDERGRRVVAQFEVDWSPPPSRAGSFDSDSEPGTPPSSPPAEGLLGLGWWGLGGGRRTKRRRRRKKKKRKRKTRRRIKRRRRRTRHRHK